MNSSSVEVFSHSEGRIAVQSPFHPEFPPEAKKLGGKWDGSKKVWTFDSRDRSRVEELCRNIYGTDGNDAGAVVTVRVAIRDGGVRSGRKETELWLLGRCLGRTFGRDYAPKYGEAVAVIEGGFSSGGSRKHPTLRVQAGTVIELRDVPRARVERAFAENDWDDSGLDVIEAEVIDPAPGEDAHTIKAELEVRRKQLLAELGEVEAALALEGAPLGPMPTHATIAVLDPLNPRFGYSVRIEREDVTLLNTDVDPASGMPLVTYADAVRVLGGYCGHS